MNKKYLFGILAFVLFVPQVTFAVWWNPGTWFNNWSFKGRINQTQVLEDRIRDLENKLNAVTPVEVTPEDLKIEAENTIEVVPEEEKKLATATSPIIKKEPAVTVPQSNSGGINKPVVSTQTENTPTNTWSELTLRCNLLDYTTPDVSTGDNINVKITIFEGVAAPLSKDYSIKWSGGKINGPDNGKTAVFVFNQPGEFTIKVRATKNSDGRFIEATCPIRVWCDDFSCLSLNEKKKSILSDITQVVEDWYDSSDVLYSCKAAESIIRALEYDYTMLGGTNISSFDKAVDCASLAAPAAYSYKIGVLKSSL